MRMFSIGLAAAMLLGVPAMAQETAPDGTKAFGFEPYVGIGGGYHDFDSGTKGVLQSQGSAKGALITGMAGFNIPLWVFVAGIEGNVAKGFSDIDWEYGVTGHLGFRIGESGMIFGRAGYQWVNTDIGDDRNEIYGFGIEAGPSDIGLGGITGESGIRLRLAVDTFDEFQSIRPTAAVIFHF